MVRGVGGARGVLEVHLDVNRTEDHENTGPLLPCEWVEKDETTEQNANELSRRHNSGEEQCAEFLDRVENAQLSEHGA